MRGLSMQVLITGGAGYLGSVLSQHLLCAGHSVVVIDNLLYGGRPLLSSAGSDGFKFVRGDIRDATKVRAACEGSEAVVHLAALVGDPACAQRPEYAREVNFGASLELIKVARAVGVKRFVFASTCSNYGRMADGSTLASEDHELRPVSLYAETKVAVERALMDRRAGHMACTILRFATLYGLSPRMRLDLTVNEFVMEMLTRRKLIVYGEEFWRPYVHVRDAARAIALVLNSAPSIVDRQVFNVGNTAENFRKIELVKLIGSRVGPAEIRFVHRAEDPRDYRVSFERIRARLGYQTTRTVVDGVDEIASAIENGLIDDPGDRSRHNATIAASV